MNMEIVSRGIVNAINQYSQAMTERANIENSFVMDEINQKRKEAYDSRKRQEDFSYKQQEEWADPMKKIQALETIKNNPEYAPQFFDTPIGNEARQIHAEFLKSQLQPAAVNNFPGAPIMPMPGPTDNQEPISGSMKGSPFLSSKDMITPQATKTEGMKGSMSGQPVSSMEKPSQMQPMVQPLDLSNPSEFVKQQIHQKIDAGQEVTPQEADIINPSSKSSYQRMQERYNKQAPEGYEINPNWTIGSKENMWVKSAKSNNAIGSLGNVQGKSTQEIQDDLKKKDPGYFNYLQNLALGKFKNTGRNSIAMQKVYEDLSTVFPGYDQNVVEARYALRKDFTSGKESTNIKSLNTAVNHLDALNNIIPLLDNTKFRKYNSLKNYLSKEVGQPQVSRAKMVVNALSGELATIFKNSAGTDIEIKNIKDSIDTSDSPEALRGAIQEAIMLMDGRMQALQDKWQNGFGDDASFPVISERSHQILKKLGWGGEGQVFDQSKQNVKKSDYSTLWQ